MKLVEATRRLARVQEALTASTAGAPAPRLVLGLAPLVAAALLLAGDLRGAPSTPPVPAGAPSGPTAGVAPGRQENASGRPLQLATALHVHSAASGGGMATIDTLAGLAREQGVDALFLAETLARDLHYGPPIIRWFFELHLPGRDLLDSGIDRYLTEVTAADRRHPEVMIFPGAEVTPYYHWTESPLQGRIELHRYQRDLLVVPPPGEGPVAAADLLRGLPVIDNRAAERYGLWSLMELVPGLLLVGWGGSRIRKRRRGRGAEVVGARRSAQGDRGERRSALRRGAGGNLLPLLAVLAGAALLLHHFPYTAPIYRPYDPDVGLAPEQRLIDHVDGLDGLTYWSTPEVDANERRRVGPIEILLRSGGYVDAVSATERFSGFGGLYADTVQAIDPGGRWDAWLGEALDGVRDRTPWMVGEADFEAPGRAGKFLSEVLTVLLVEERSRRAAFEALRDGRSYALRQARDDGLRLAEFSVGPVSGGQPSEAAGRRTTGRVERVGGTLELSGTATVRIRVEVVSRSGEPLPIDVRIVRGGEILERHETATPFVHELHDTLANGIAAAHYRVDVRGRRPHRLVSNPIFVIRGGDR